MNTARVSRAIRAVQTEAGAVLQNTDNGATLSTNVVGARIWTHLTAGLTDDEIIDRVSAEFCVARDQVCSDVEQFMSRLNEEGLLRHESSQPQ